MEQPDQKRSKRTIVIGSAHLIVSAIGLALILALLVCFAVLLLHSNDSAVGKLFPRIVVLIVYDAVATVLLSMAHGLSLRRDQAS